MLAMVTYQRSRDEGVASAREAEAMAALDNVPTEIMQLRNSLTRCHERLS